MDEIVEMIRKRFPGKEIDEGTSLSYIAEDSFGRIEMLVEIEQALKIKISEDDILDMETVGDLVKIARKLKN